MKSISNNPSFIIQASLLIVMMTLTGCFKLYYQTNSVPETDAVQLDQLRKQDKIFVIHTAAEVFELDLVHIEENHLTGHRVAIDPKYDRLLNPVKEKDNPVNRKIKKVCFEQVHLYTKTVFPIGDSVKLPIQDIRRMDVYSPDKDAIRASRVASIIAITLCAGAVIGLGFYAASTIVFF